MIGEMIGTVIRGTSPGADGNIIEAMRRLDRPRQATSPQQVQSCMSVLSGVRAVILVLCAAVLLPACASRPPVGADGRPVPVGARATNSDALAPVNMADVYRSMGLVAARGSIPFVARVAFLPDRTTDSTLVLVSMSMAPRFLAFAREDNQYTGRYAVALEIRDGPNLVRRVESTEALRVATFRETSRTDESVIWQQYVRVAPGQFTLGMAVRDLGSPRASVEEVSLLVPRLAVGAIASPVPVYEVVARSSPDSLPRLLARPRATVTFGVDSVVPVYLEIPGIRLATTVRTEVIGEGGAELWRDSTVLLGRGGDLVSGTIFVPAASLGVGVVTLRASTREGTDTAQTKLLVTLGDDLPVTNFDEMISYLRYFAPDYTLKALRESTGAARAQAWSQFLRDTDTNPGTSEHEGLRDYFARIRLANQRFRDDGQVGWLTDRGTAFVGLGDPDNIFDAPNTNINNRNRQQVWDYREWRLRLVFFDETGLGRWRLSPGAQVEMAATIRRRLAQLN